MQFSTWCAAGNTYLVAHGGEVRLDGSQVRRLAEGTDGVLEVLSASEAAVEIVVWNPDGSQAELSGNGTRIAAAWLAAGTGAREIEVAVGERRVVVRLREDGALEQDVGEVLVGEVGEVEGIRFIPVSVGNPHTVVVADPAQIVHIGPLLETNPRFPARTNVEVVRVDRPGEVTARVWERGVGETLSSGTGAVAVAAATHDGGDVLVHFPGGDLRVRLESGRASLVGPAERVG